MVIQIPCIYFCGCLFENIYLEELNKYFEMNYLSPYNPLSLFINNSLFCKVLKIYFISVSLFFYNKKKQFHFS